MGVVVIGRNEGERLERCLNSLTKLAITKVVYVDSGSTDGSVKFARNLGIDVVELDLSIPFTAGRARDTGFKALLDAWPDTQYVQLIDSDCDMSDAWYAQAVKFLKAREDVGVVVGRLRERYRDATDYNMMIDLEWDQPMGEVNACVGTHMVRVASYQKVGGFNPIVIAAEDDELCFRIRNAGWKVIRLEIDMAIHDVAMTKFNEWWHRSVRAGHGYAQVGHLHPGYFVAERRRTWFWGGVLPILTLGLMPLTNGLSLLLLLLFIVSFIRTRSNLVRSGVDKTEANIFAKFLTISKFPALIGMLKYWYRYALKRENKLIEYK